VKLELFLFIIKHQNAVGTEFGYCHYYHEFCSPLLGLGLFSVGLLWRVISPTQRLYLLTEHKHTHKKTHTKEHPCLEWDSTPRSQNLKDEASLCLGLLDHCDGPNTGIPCSSLYSQSRHRNELIGGLRVPDALPSWKDSPAQNGLRLCGPQRRSGCSGPLLEWRSEDQSNAIKNVQCLYSIVKKRSVLGRCLRVNLRGKERGPCNP
jgi:hypothetical protein